MTIPLVDTHAGYEELAPELEAAACEVLRGGTYILGDHVTALENEVATYIGVEHAVAVANGTDALVLTLRALEVGVGDEVLVPAFTFFATVEAVLLVGAKPVFVDITPDDYSLDIAAVEAAITDRTVAAIPVHLFGHPVDMTALSDVCERRGIEIIEDNAQAFGAMWNSCKTGAFGAAGCLSFFPTKNLGGFGDGGMVVTNQATIAEKVRMLRTHGWRRKYEPEMVGYNSRLDEIQAALLRVKLPRVDEHNDRRRRLAARYTQQLDGVARRLPRQHSQAHHVYHLYTVEVEARDEVVSSLLRSGVGCGVYYPAPVHLVGPCAHLDYAPGDMPVSEAASRDVLSLPLYPQMSDAQQDEVIEAFKDSVLERKQTS